MLADSIVSLAYIAGRSVLPYSPSTNLFLNAFWRRQQQGYAALSTDQRAPASPLSDLAPEMPSPTQNDSDETDLDGEVMDEEKEDAPIEHQIGNTTVLIGLMVSILFCIAAIHLVFNRERVLVPLYATAAAVILALLLSISTPPVSCMESGFR